MKPLAALAVTSVLAIALAVAGCSDGDSGTSGVESPSDPEPVLDVASWTEHRDCGYTVFAGNADGTQQLVVNPLDLGIVVEPVVVEPIAVELPSPEWRVVVELGRHFGERGFVETGSCTDVIDGGDPEPEVDEEWDVVAGTFTIEPERGGGFPITAVLTAEDLVAQGPDGEQVPLGDIRIVSECWGCFQG